MNTNHSTGRKALIATAVAVVTLAAGSAFAQTTPPTAAEQFTDVIDSIDLGALALAVGAAGLAFLVVSQAETALLFARRMMKVFMK